MRVGDLVKMPGSCYRDEDDTEVIGVITRTDCHGPRELLLIYWIQDKEYSWEPAKWLEVISEA